MRGKEKELTKERERWRDGAKRMERGREVYSMAAVAASGSRRPRNLKVMGDDGGDGDGDDDDGRVSRGCGVLHGGSGR